MRHKSPPDLELPPDEGDRSSGEHKSTNSDWTTLDYIADFALASAPPLSAPASSRFEIRRVLGSGGFGAVDLAWDNVLQREVALKRPLARLGPRQQQLFLDEARLAARIRHPGIIVVHDVEVDGDGQPFIVYEYHPGGSLRERLRGAAWTLPAALALMLELAEALAEAHRNGLTHRDLKPGNILFDRTDHAQIADFGLAVDEASQRDLSGEITGTYRYMAPEQFRGEVDRFDGRTDLWALGVIFFELLTGRHPFQGEDFDNVRGRGELEVAIAKGKVDNEYSD
ncbi:MAG: serine/threonine protein kinase [Planctomycetaceae bacterium]|nr:serine/threonine protein kinase [Planctomycetaceae bacterium]